MAELVQNGKTMLLLQQNYALKLLISFKMVHLCCFTLVGNLDFLDLLQKKFYNIDDRILCFSTPKGHILAVAELRKGAIYDMVNVRYKIAIRKKIIAFKNKGVYYFGSSCFMVIYLVLRLTVIVT